MFRYCLNTSTLRGYELPLDESIRVAAAAGYHAVEPWISEIEAYRDSGKPLTDLRQQVSDAGLSIQGAIGFFNWIVDDEADRAAALERARRDMELVAGIGGTLIAAPPMGAVEISGIDLLTAAERYAELVNIGREFGVRPLVEVWGFSKTLNRLGEAAFIAVESGVPEAAILADVYHLYKGGSPISGLSLLNGERLPLLHVNDYPEGIDADSIQDADRVWPGDGVAPWSEILGTLADIGFDGYLSLELFNPTYWKGEPLETARTGLEKLRFVVERFESGEFGL